MSRETDKSADQLTILNCRNCGRSYASEEAFPARQWCHVCLRLEELSRWQYRVAKLLKEIELHFLTLNTGGYVCGGEREIRKSLLNKVRRFLSEAEGEANDKQVD